MTNSVMRLRNVQQSSLSLRLELGRFGQDADQTDQSHKLDGSVCSTELHP